MKGEVDKMPRGRRRKYSDIQKRKREEKNNKKERKKGRNNKDRFK